VLGVENERVDQRGEGLGKGAAELVSDINSFQDPLSRTQLETVPEALDRLQRKLNRIQGEADAWGEEEDRRVA
jgi:hypothetical protein